MRISDWSSDGVLCRSFHAPFRQEGEWLRRLLRIRGFHRRRQPRGSQRTPCGVEHGRGRAAASVRRQRLSGGRRRSEEHTSELQSLMRISYAVFCLKKKTQTDDKSENS